MYKIGFLSSLNPFDINNWSGTLYYIVKSLYNHEIEWIGKDVFNKILVDEIPGNKYPEDYAEFFGAYFSERINIGDYDIIIVRDYFFGAYLKIDIPIVYIGDTTFKLFKSNIRIKSDRFEIIANDIENRMIANADTIIYSSNIAKDSAIKDYSCNPLKIHVVEFGPNIPTPVDYKIHIQTNICNLVFIGKNWDKKGGQKALNAFRQLKAEGFPCKLTIIGSVPDTSLSGDNDLIIIPFLDKSRGEHLEMLDKILKCAHFLVLPTEFDAFGIVFCEASAYGVPSITANVGGVSQPVREGKNGYLLPASASASDYAEKIKLLFSDNDKYMKLRTSSRQEYETRLNWDVWREKVNKILNDTLVDYKKSKNVKLLEDAKNDFYLPVYVINLKDRIDRRLHCIKQFEDKREFKINFIVAEEHPIGAVGLWKSIVKAVQLAIQREDDIIIICEDDHIFTSAYNKDYFFANIIKAEAHGSELLAGGVGGFGTAVPVDTNLYWVDWFWCTQFIIVFESLFQKILDYDFKDSDTADNVLSVLANDTMTIYPFVSIQKDFGYSDVTPANNRISGMISNHFRQADYRLGMIHHVFNKFRKVKNSEFGNTNAGT